MTPHDIELLRALLDGDLSAAAPLLDRLTDQGDIRRGYLCMEVGRLIRDVEVQWEDYHPDEEPPADTAWGRAHTTSMALARFREEVQSLFWVELRTFDSLADIAGRLRQSLDLVAEADRVPQLAGDAIPANLGDDELPF